MGYGHLEEHEAIMTGWVMYYTSNGGFTDKVKLTDVEVDDEGITVLGHPTDKPDAAFKERYLWKNVGPKMAIEFVGAMDTNHMHKILGG
jgi:hypothetical protein